MHYPPTDLPVALPCVMGIVNATPDSFSDGGEHADTGSAVAHGLRLAAEGAAILDIGGESTRPGSDPVPVDEEVRRVVPVVEGLAAVSPVVLSVDTTKAAVARAALDAGAAIVNDVTALRGDPAMAALVAERGCPVCLMHMLGEPRTMQDDPRYDDVVAEVTAFLEARLAAAVAAGVREEQVLLDPGIGFGKTLAHNLALLAHLDRIAAIGRPVVLGASRKRFTARCSGSGPASAWSGPWRPRCSAWPAGPPCCACTTCGPMSRPCAWRRPSSPWRRRRRDEPERSVESASAGSRRPATSA